ncbi:hypothetical protein Hanom_Chr17g01589131 [Helianthus anomalus]
MITGWYHQPHQLYRSSLGRERNTLQKIKRGKKLNYEDPILILSLPRYVSLYVVILFKYVNLMVKIKQIICSSENINCDNMF